jgi:antitoxin component of RelBE/YafQ-DinJ toxin-antitoxin module
MNTSVAVNKFARVVVRDQKLPFDVAAHPHSLIKAELKRRIDNLENGGGSYHDLVEDDGC